MSEMRLTFHGAVGGHVTGSMHLLECAGARFLFDAGLFQGRRADTERTADTIAASTTPPAGFLSHPTLCTGWDPGIPHPPAAGATPEGKGSCESPGS
jgi:hypothetical protein